MIAMLPLKKMSVQDKISAMESIWEDLCRNAGDIASPEWHRNVLNEREENLKSGADSFIDWEEKTGAIPIISLQYIDIHVKYCILNNLLTRS